MYFLSTLSRVDEKERTWYWNSLPFGLRSGPSSSYGVDNAMERALISNEGRMPSVASPHNLMTADRLAWFEREAANFGMTFDAFYIRCYQESLASIEPRDGGGQQYWPTDSGCFFCK